MHSTIKYKPKSKPAQRKVAKELSLYGFSNKEIAIALNTTARSISGSILSNKCKRSRKEGVEVNILSKALLSRPMSEWGFVYNELRG